jgi:16S rRNA (guanine527-N7)-methyltransferase
MSEFLKSYIYRMGIVMADEQAAQLETMLDLLEVWNTKHNLTRLRNRRDQEIYHVLDALSAYHYFSVYSTILDMGTGAGFPGMPLAIMYPEKHFHLVDSNGKKTAYLKQLVKHIDLKNVTVHHTRSETLVIDHVDVVTARAVADPSIVIKLTQHLKPRAYVLYVGPNCPKVLGSKIEKVEVPLSSKEHYILTMVVTE